MSSPLGGIPDFGKSITSALKGWYATVHGIAQATSSNGPTTLRPTKNLYIGQFWYDTTLGYPVWVHSLNPIVWHNGAGASV